MRSCRQIRKDALKLWYTSNDFGLEIFDCDATLLLKFEDHLSRADVEYAEHAKTKVKIKLYGATWANLLAWCKAIWERNGYNTPVWSQAQVGEVEEAVVRSAHRTVSPKKRWQDCKEELAELRFLADKLNDGDGWLWHTRRRH